MRARALPVADDVCGWTAGLPPLEPARPLRGSERVDCAVVGAGFTGLATARRLAGLRADWRIAVLDAQRVGDGASGRNSGFVVDLPHYAATRGVDGNARLLRLGRAGLARLRELVAAHAIDCEWTERGRLHGAATDFGLRALDAFCAGADALGQAYDRLDRHAIAAITGSTYYRAAARTAGSAMVQPAALARGLARALPQNVLLFEESAVRAIERDGGFTLQTDAGAVRADRLFIATNGLTPALGLLRDRVFPLMTFASLTRALTPGEAAALGGEPVWGLVSEAQMGTTVRRLAGERLLIRNTVRYRPALRGDAALHRRVRDVHRAAFLARFPMLESVEFQHTWGGVMGVTFNGAQYFGELEPRLFAAAAYNGVGVAMGTISGELLAELALGIDTDLLADMRALPGPDWIPPEPALGIGVRATLAYLSKQASGE